MRAAWRRLNRDGEAWFFFLRLIGTALFPRLAYRLRWPTRLRGLKLAAYVALNALLVFEVRQLASRMIRRRAEVVERLREELGREPSLEELHAEFTRAYEERRRLRE